MRSTASSAVEQRKRSAQRLTAASFVIACHSHAEPTEDWTVEEVFQWTLLRSYAVMDERIENIAQGLRSDFDKGGRQLEHVRKEVAQKQPPRPDAENRLNEGDSSTRTAAAATKTTETTTTAAAKTNKTARASVTVKAQVVRSDAYMDAVFNLKVTKSKACWIGRSSGKKFRINGISLSKDGEVSTTHGKFEMHKDGQVYFTDLDSTNGSKLDKVELEPDVPYLVENGATLSVGATMFEITIV